MPPCAHSRHCTKIRRAVSAMAFRDVAGLMNGLRKVGGAMWCETNSELRHSLANSSLRSAADSLAAVVGHVVGRRESGGGEGFRIRGDFSDWEECVSVLDGGWLGGREGGGRSRTQHDGGTGETLSSPASEGQREETRDSNWFPPPPRPGPGVGGRQYHSSAVPHPQHTHWRGLHTGVPRPHHAHWRGLHTGVSHPHHVHWRGLHTGVWCGSETVVGGATRQVVASKSKSQEHRSKQEVSKQSNCSTYMYM